MKGLVQQSLVHSRVRGMKDYGEEQMKIEGGYGSTTAARSTAAGLTESSYAEPTAAPGTARRATGTTATGLTFQRVFG